MGGAATTLQSVNPTDKAFTVKSMSSDKFYLAKRRSTVKSTEPMSPFPESGNPEIDKRRSTMYQEGIHAALAPRKPNEEQLNSNKMDLPRGGVYVKTTHGPIQFGIPPETIKDAMSLGLSVPHYYVVPRQQFDLEVGVNVAEIEFPAYFNFFVLQKSVHLICTSSQKQSINDSFKEIILGPEQDKLHIDEEYGDIKDPKVYGARPDMRREMDYFVEPRGGRLINHETLVQYTEFKHKRATVVFEVGDNGENGGDKETASVEIWDNGSEYRVYEEKKLIATVSYEEAGYVPTPTEVLSSEMADVALVGQFNRPDFGVTMIGSSHGFDSSGSTTGFIIWINGQGIVVDPPPHCDTFLQMNAVSPRVVTDVILTHCHADHDAGTFQKILLEGKTTLHTTRTIKEMFLRKYSASTGLKEEFLGTLFQHGNVLIGQPIYINGGVFRFFYALHALPCIGFEVHYGGKSISYSADTFNDKEGLMKLRERGILSEARTQSLINFPWHCDIVLHECGVPPIHTPPSTIKNLPPEIQKNVYAVHIAENKAKAEGLRRALPGLVTHSPSR